MYYTKSPRETLSLTQQFAVATLALGAGLAAAFGVNATVTPLAEAVVNTPLVPFVLNMGALYLAMGTVAGYAEETMRQSNAAWRTRNQPPWMQPKP